MTNLRKLIIAAILIGLVVVFTKLLSIQTPIVRISFTFIPIIFGAIFLGPAWSSLIAVAGDLIGAFLFPSGAFFPGFTLSALLTGLIYGLFLYNKGKEMDTKKFVLRLLLSSFIVILFVQALLNTLWVTIITGQAAFVIVPTRLAVQFIMLPVQIIVMFTLDRALRKPIRRIIHL